MSDTELKRIPKTNYHKVDGEQFVTKELIEQYHTPKEVENFSLWFCGQTGIVTSDGSLGIYICDYERWLEQGRLTKQLPHDWD